MEVVKAYSSDRVQRERLYPLFETVFGIPAEGLQDFYERGFWNPTYTPCTLFKGEQAVANASWFAMQLVVDGELRQAAGIQSVMTHPDFRGRGFMKKLFAEMLQDIDEAVDLALLQTSSPELYLPFGFRVVEEFLFETRYDHAGGSGLRRVDFFEELGLVRELFANAQPLSERAAPVGYLSSWALNLYDPQWQERLYLAQSLSALVLYEVEDGTLKLYDVIAPQLPTLAELTACIPEPFSQIEFWFSPDRFWEATAVPSPLSTKLMVRGAFETDKFKWPLPAAF